MSDKRESFKKSLGITEYPWSSDDEQNDIAQPMSSIQSMQSEPTQVHHTVEIPSTSAAGPSGSQVMARSWSDADQARQDRQSYWSYLSNPMLSGSRPRPVAHTQRPTSPAYCEGVTNRWARRRDMKRYVALMKLKNNRITQHLLTALGESHSSGSGLYSSPARPSLSADVLTRPGHVFAARTNRLADLSAAEAGPSSLSERNLAENADGDATDAPEPINVDHSEDDEESPDQSSESILQQLQADDNAQARQEHAEAVARHGAGAEAAPDLPAAHAADPPPQEAENAADSSLDGSEPNSVKEFNMNLLRLLECPVCLEWMEPPMSQCRRGHLVCGRCRARLAACPVCRTSFSSVRNRAMEWVAEMLRYPCRHGCGREVRLRRRGTHEASCPARRYRCIAPECARQDPMPRDALTRHAQSKHLSMLKIGRKHKFALKLNADRRENWLVMCLNEMFHLKIDVDIRTWTVVVYLAYIGPKCNSNNYTYEVTVLGQDNLRKLSYTRQTHCDLESTSLNVGRQDCFHLSIDQALNFLRVKNRNCLTDQLLHFDIELNRVEVAQEAE